MTYTKDVKSLQRDTLHKHVAITQNLPRLPKIHVHDRGIGSEYSLKEEAKRLEKEFHLLAKEFKVEIKRENGKKWVRKRPGSCTGRVT
jgi:hypothetical protein